MNETEFVGGIIGTGISAIGTATQTNEILQTISICITIAGGIVSLIIIPLYNWYKKAKQDGSITKDEINEGVKTLQKGINEIKDVVDKNKKGGNDQ